MPSEHFSDNVLRNIPIRKVTSLRPRFRVRDSKDLTILGRQRDDDGQNKLLQINGNKDNSSYIINRMNLMQS
jgi:hypothetical protein